MLSDESLDAAPLENTRMTDVRGNDALLADSATPHKAPSRPLKVALFTESYRPVINGVTRSVETLRDGLEARGHQAVIYAPGAPGLVEENRGVRRFPWYRVPGFPEYPLAFPFSPALFREFRGMQFDLVHVQTPFALGTCGLVLARLCRIPVLAHMHTLYVEYAHYLFCAPRALSRPFLRSLTRWFYNLPDEVVVPSPSVRAFLLSIGIRRPVNVVPTGVTLPRSTSRADARQQLGLEAGAPAVLYTGRLAPEKNIGLLLESFARTRRKIPSARLLVLGGGSGRSAAEQQAHQLGIAGAVTFFGFQPHDRVLTACAAADLFLFPSETDTQAVSVLEAMAFGVPAVVVNAFGPADIVQDGISGRVVHADAESMSRAAVDLLLDDPERRRLGAGARARAAELSADHTIERLLAIYSRMVAA